MNVAITGNTFPVKDQLKALGGRWDADRKAWMVPAANAAAAQTLVAKAPKQPYRGRYDPNKFHGYGARHGGYTRRNEDDECEVCGKNKYSCGHCVGW